MPAKLNTKSYEHAQQLIVDRRIVFDDRDDWSEHQPSSMDENAFIAAPGWRAYARWHLGVDDTRPRRTKAHYTFPYGDFHDVHRCALLSAGSRASQRGYRDVARAVTYLHALLEFESGRAGR
jgi:hypothetical protein